MFTSVRLGPFEVTGVLGEGGMGTVYWASHVDTREPVAIKVLSADVADHARRRREFRREVQALGKLRHPGIASVADYGRIPPDAVASGPDQFVEGAPWFAMEYVEGRPWDPRMLEGNWSDLRMFLSTVLDALAHAHARQVVHRDLKPGNILVEGTGETGEWGVKLVDFGIAHIFDADRSEEETSSRRVVGTPQYMAPEQIRGAHHDQGPWTDLYALGCLIWGAVCGKTPFEGDSVEETLERQLEETPGPFEPEFPVPAGLERWLRGLLQKDVDRRTGRAADAAWALFQLPEPRGSPDPNEDPGGARRTTGATAIEDTLGTVADSATSSDRLESSRGERESGSPVDEPEEITAPLPVLGTAERPPVVPDWRRRTKPGTAAQFPRAGLELFGLREVPMVDRERERDRLWEELRSVAENGTPRLAILEGQPGTGKSRVARWLSRRAHEVGAAKILRAKHSATGGEEHALRELVRGAVRARRTSRGELFERLLERLPTLGDGAQRLADARALVELLHPTDDDADEVEGPRYRFADPEHKYEVVRRLLVRLGQERPLVVWCDDLHWGGATIDLLRSLFDRHGPAPPVLVVATIRRDLLVEADRRARAIEDIADAADATRIELAPLEPADHRELVDRTLELEPELAESLADRTEGHPLFAVELLRDWVDRGVLQPSTDGFQLQPGEEIDVPDDIHRLWQTRITAVAQECSDVRDRPLWRALEAAAAMGRSLPDSEWRAICRDIGIERSDAIRDALVDRGLAERTAQGWAFSHQLLVDSLERHARDRDRWARQHRRCGEIVEELYAEEAPEAAARRAEHWIEGEELERAVDALIEEYRNLTGHGELDRELQILERRASLLESLGIPRGDARWIENDIELANTRLNAGASPDEVVDRARGATRRARDAGEDRLLAAGLNIVGRGLRRRTDNEEARNSLRRAVRVAERAGEEEEKIFALLECGWLERGEGEFEKAEECIRRGYEAAKEAGHSIRIADALRGLAGVAKDQGDLERAEQLYEATVEWGREGGFRLLEALSTRGLADLAKFRGERDRARELYRSGRNIAVELHQHRLRVGFEVSLGFVEASAGDFERAEEQFERAEALMERQTSQVVTEQEVTLGRLVCAAGRGAWSVFDERLEFLRDSWSETDYLERDFPWLLERAGDYAAEAGAADRARRVWRLARAHWERMESPESIQRLDRKLEEET